MQTCASCPHFMATLGVCRRNPPMPFIVGMDPLRGPQMISNYVPVRADLPACGEHPARRNPGIVQEA